MAQEEPSISVVLFGNASAVNVGPENVLLGEDLPITESTEVSQIVPISRRVAEHKVSVINLLGLEETEFSSHTVHQLIRRLANENQIHAFIFVLQLNRLTDTNKLGLEWLKRTFGEPALSFVMILFTYERQEECDTIIDDLKKNTVLEQLIQQCGGRYCTCSKSMNNQSEIKAVLEKIQHLVSENNQCCYTAEIYNTSFRSLQAKNLQEEVDIKEDLTKQPQIKTSDLPEEVKDLFSIILKNNKKILTLADVLEINTTLQYLRKLMMMNYNARYLSVTTQTTEENEKSPEPVDNQDEENTYSSSSYSVNEQMFHPMDLQMAVFHCSDLFLKQLIVTKLAQCQYALPLLVPDPFTREIQFPLWTFRQIRKTWKTSGDEIIKTQAIAEAETPMVAFFRLGDLVTLSKSHLMNNLINEKYDTFCHWNCSGGSRNRLLMDGVVEIAWYYPSGKKTDYFTECVAFCNLHGDALSHKEQVEILTEMSSVNVVIYSEQEKTKNETILKNLSENPKPLIHLVTSRSSRMKQKRNQNTIYLKEKNQSEVSKELRTKLHKCFSSNTKFRLEDVCEKRKIRTDEKDEKCQKGKDEAIRMTHLLDGMEETCLPCQGKLWHDWCKKNKEFHRLQGSNIEQKRCEKQNEMMEIRTQQHECGVTKPMEMFINTLNSSNTKDKNYFLKWLVILLDNFTADKLSGPRDSHLHDVSEQLKPSAIGLEHLLREMGQIYESHVSVQTHRGNLGEDLPFLPKLGAEVMLSGYPLEIMDGDAGHVPLMWVSAVLDELVKILGDQRVFVLSVLGIQSSGKSTMLNAMFGLQFAVSAGRCTRGAFMQLVRVSEEMKEELKFDFLLVVDTEGLRALELAEKTTIHHDNELATFVVGLGNLTLINIFGENPAEMQDILQIVVQAFLRMKKVRLNPRCMFVHQNVVDITAGEKNAEGRRCLQERLDGMTKLASKEEDGDAQCFSDIIAFDVQSDVKYFAQLWEGSPPMAPPNPSYSENIEELRRNIMSKISTNHGVTLSQFKSSISDLWNALLNENFVFSFRNTLEIAVYRKLEHEYTRWTWSLRSAMLLAENKLLNRVNNERSLRIEEKDLVAEMAMLKKKVDKEVDVFFRDDRDKEITIQWQEKFERKILDLYNELVEAAKRKLDQVYQQKMAREKVDEEKTRYENNLFKLSKELAFNLKNKQTDGNALTSHFDDVWSTWLSEVSQDAPTVGDIDVRGDVTKILSETFELLFVCDRQNLDSYKKLDTFGDYSDYVIFKKSQVSSPQNEQPTEVNTEQAGILSQTHKFVSTLWSTIRPTSKQPENKSTTNMLSSKENNQIRTMIKNVSQKSKSEIQRMSSSELGYNHGYIQQIIQLVKTNIYEHQQNFLSIYTLKKEFTVDLCLYICTFAAEKFTELHMKFKEANDVRLYLSNQKLQYFNIFKNYYNGATSAAVFGEFIVNKLEPSILQAAFDQTAIDVAEKMKRDIPAFSGNRSNLEKHILTSLAEEENFESYTEYLHKPKEYFNNFITKEVDKYLLQDKSQEVLEMIKANIKSKGKRVMDAVNKSTDDVNKIKGNIDMWLENFSKELQDELQFKEESCLEQKEMTDLGFLQEIVNKGLNDTVTKLYHQFKTISDITQEIFQKKPHKVLIDHLCQCCWAQCPFCDAICTNTMEDHDGDHRVRFHRNCGISGWSFMFSENLGVDFCTTAVSSNQLFFKTPAGVFYFKEYRKAGGEHARWNISPDHSEMPYWKWFVCRFQEDLEKHYKRKFTGNGEIPQEWKKISKDRAIGSLNEL